MGFDTARYSFQQLLSNIVDNRGKTCPVTEQGLPLIATNCVKNETLYPVFEKVRYVDSDTYENWFRGHPKPGDLIFVTKGSPGNVCLTPDPVNFCIAQDMVGIRANEEVIDPKYLFALLRSQATQTSILNMHVGTLIPHFKKGDFKNLFFEIPTDLEVQKRIGDIYLNFCEKIELNRQINTTLESMAQALFKSWFVDFDPVIDNALAAGNEIPDELAARAARREALRQQTNKSKGATNAASSEQALPDTDLSDQSLPSEIQQLFPDRFVFTEEMGWVPEGWEVAQIKDIAEYGNGRVEAVEITRDNYVSTENMLVDKAGVVAASSVPETAHVPSYEKGSILISNIRPYFKKIWLASHSGGRSNDVLEFKVKAAGTEGYLYSLLCQDSFFEYMMATSKGTKMPRGDKQAIMNWAVAVPSLDLRELFSEQVILFQGSVVSRNEQSLSLASLRDSLLPKLLSGQITIPDAEQQLAEVL